MFVTDRSVKPENLRMQKEALLQHRKRQVLKIFAKLCTQGKIEDFEKCIRDNLELVHEPLNWRYNEDSWPALLYACRGHNLEIIKKLLELGADPSFTAKSGMTPLMAVITGVSDKSPADIALTCAQVLLDVGGVSVPNTAQFGKRTLLTYSIVGIQPRAQQLVNFLLENGADPNERDGFGDLPFNLAVATDQTEVMTSLEQHGASPHEIDQVPDTPFNGMPETEGQSASKSAIEPRMDSPEFSGGEENRPLPGKKFLTVAGFGFAAVLAATAYYKKMKRGI